MLGEIAALGQRVQKVHGGSEIQVQRRCDLLRPHAVVGRDGVHDRQRAGHRLNPSTHGHRRFSSLDNMLGGGKYLNYYIATYTITQLEGQ